MRCPHCGGTKVESNGEPVGSPTRTLLCVTRVAPEHSTLDGSTLLEPSDYDSLGRLPCGYQWEPADMEWEPAEEPEPVTVKPVVLSELHQDILSIIAHESRWIGRHTAGWAPRPAGINSRSLRLLGRLGLVEHRTLTGTRGGRHVQLRLTAEGILVAQRIGEICEGTAPQNRWGDMDRTVHNFVLAD